MRTRREASWLRVVLHGGVVAVSLFLAGLVLLALTGAGRSDALGQAVGRLPIFLGLVAFGVSYAHQTGKVRLAFTLGGFGVLLVLGFVVSVFLLRQGFIVPRWQLTDAERTPPREVKVNGRPFFCQDAWGFYFPGAREHFFLREDLQSKTQALMAGERSADALAIWPFDHGGTNGFLVIKAIKGIGAERTFRAFARTYKAQLAAGSNLDNVREELEWTEDGGEYRLTGTIGPMPRHSFELRCLASGEDWPTENRVVCAETMTQGVNWLGFSLRGLRLESCSSIDESSPGYPLLP